MCGEEISEKEPRGVSEGGGFYCYKCVPHRLKNQIDVSKKMERYFKILMEKSKKQMILNRL